MAEKIARIVYENTVPAVFVKRYNRFSAGVLIDGKEETVHVKNTGRLGELLVPGAAVTLQKAENPARKTAYDLISVYKQGLDWVNIDSLAPNALMKQYLENLRTYDLVKPEYKYGNSRFDFYLERGEEKYLREVKGCTLAEGPDSSFGLFPDAPTERGLKHIRELTAAAGRGYHCSIDFVIQMNGIRIVLPNDSTMPAFRAGLTEAARAGVEINSLTCRVEADRIMITGCANDAARSQEP